MRVEAPARAMFFWCVCIPLRYYLAEGDVPPSLLRPFAAAIGLRWIAGLENGDEGMFGGPVWWHDERLAHGILWFLYAITGDKFWLRADATAGVANWLHAKLPKLKVPDRLI